MTTIALRRPSMGKSFWALILLTAFFFAVLGWTTASLLRRQVSEVPLKPCRQCTSGCPCPRLSGSVRCGCPD